MIDFHQRNIKTVLCPALESNTTPKVNRQILVDSIPEIDQQIEQNYQQFVAYSEDLKLPFFPIVNQYMMQIFMRYKYPFAAP